MEYLPCEIHLKIFKYLNFDELFAVKQANRYFRDFINKYKGDLARKRFYQLAFAFDRRFNLQSIRKPKSKSIDFPLSNHLKDQWLSAVDKRIPICFNFRSTNINDTLLLLFSPKENSHVKDIFNLRLPVTPKHIGEMKIVRYWLKEIILCNFKIISSNEFIFNQEMIELLLDSDEISQMKLNFEPLAYCKFLNIYFESIITTKDSSNLLKLLLNEGNKIFTVTLYRFDENQSTLYNHLLNHIETATDLSKMVANIRFFGLCLNRFISEGWPRSKLIVRGVEGRGSRAERKYYKITNIHNSKIVFLVMWYLSTRERDYVTCIEIYRIR